MARYKRTGYDRKQVIIQDNCCCRRCGAGVEEVPLEVHHIVPLMYGGTNEYSNLAALCPLCHKQAPDVMPGDEAQFAVWCEEPAEHLLLIAAQLNMANPRDAAIGFARVSKAIKRGLADDAGDLEYFERFLGPNAVEERERATDEPLDHI